MTSWHESPLWPDTIPLVFAPDADEQITERPIPVGWSGKNRAVRFVSEPTLTIHRPERPNGQAVLVFPGGGYEYLEIDKEGHQIAAWLTTLGLTAAVVKYRTCPPSQRQPRQPRPQPIADAILADGLRAVRLLRSMASELGIDPDSVGAIGFSAGGHMVANVAVSAGVADPLGDAVGQHSARLAFVAPIYLGISDDILAKMDSSAPPAFLCDTDQDQLTPPENSLRYYQACRKHGVSAELHIYRRGRHGFALGAPDLPVSDWARRFEAWLGDLDL